MKKNWLTLNQHGKHHLWMYCFAITTNDITQTCMDYLMDKDLVMYKTDLEPHDKTFRMNHGVWALTDLGITTIKHYFPGAI